MYSDTKLKIGAVNTQSYNALPLYSKNHGAVLHHERRDASSAIFCDGCTARSNDLAGSPWEARDARELLSAATRAVQRRLRDVEERKASEPLAACPSWSARRSKPPGTGTWRPIVRSWKASHQAGYHSVSSRI